MSEAGQRVSEFILQERIGRGAFGEVWKARHHIWADQLAAIKIPTDPQYLRNLQREGAAIHDLVHPNIVRAIGFDPYAPTPYLAMEYVPGSSLRPLIQKRSLSPDDSVLILRQVLAALEYAHSHGVIHRDIKPENILIHQRALVDGFGAEGVVKVTDFGLGCSTAAPAADSIVYSASLASPEARAIAGTLDYMAPETRGGGAVDARADLYACGVVLYEMLTGERPAGTEVPGDLNKAVPAYLNEAFRKSYARLDRRFTSAKEFAQALRPAIPLPPHNGVAPGRIRPTIGSGRRQCPRCRQAVDPADQFCMHCGVQMVPNVRRCPRCGSYPDPTDQYCIFCGQTLTLEATVG